MSVDDLEPHLASVLADHLRVNTSLADGRLGVLAEVAVDGSRSVQTEGGTQHLESVAYGAVAQLDVGDHCGVAVQVDPVWCLGGVLVGGTDDGLHERLLVEFAETDFGVLDHEAVFAF